MSREWFVEAFGALYPEVYAHRDDEAARREAEFAARVLKLSPGARVLDLACGTGRHSRALRDLGLRVTAMDLSPELLAAALAAEAPRKSGTSPEYVRGDMRALPFAPSSGSFDAVCQLFTSFGYFADSREDEGVLAEVRRVLRPGGRYLFDYLNAGQVVADLVPDSTERMGRFMLRQRRRITPDGSRVEKDVVIRDGESVVSRYTESVRLYTSREVQAMMGRSGLRPVALFGDLAGGPFEPRSPRLVVVARC